MFDPSVDIYYDEKCKNDLPSLKPWGKKNKQQQKKNSLIEFQSSDL